MGIAQYLASPWTDPDQKTSAHGDSVRALDGVRGVAVLIVIASHTNAFAMSGQGSLGVLLFFTLSGFVLMLPFADHPERIFRIGSVMQFFANRALRIVPIFVVAVLYIAWLTGKDSAWIWENVTFVSGWNHLWSIAEEARFYALFPLVVAALALLPTRPLRIIALCVMVGVAGYFRHAHLISMMIPGQFVEFYFWFFLTGMLSATLYRSAATLAHNATARLMFGIASILILLFVLLSSDALISQLWRPIFPDAAKDFALNGWNQPSLWCALFGVLLFSITTFSGTASRWLQSRWLRHLGLLSYSLYLFHVPVMIVLEPWGFQKEGLLVATIALTYLIAVVAYLAVEKPALMLKPFAQRGAGDLGLAARRVFHQSAPTP